MARDENSLPDHVEETVQAVADLNIQHHHNTPALQRLVAKTIRFIGRPRFVAFLTLAIVGWISLSLLPYLSGRVSFDPPPFSGLQTVAAVLSLYFTLLILITQRHEDQLADRREQLTLQLAILAERKTAKIIELLQELRRDHPQLDDSNDPHANDMARAADTMTILDALDATHTTSKGRGR